jgi:putative peptidoglycan lipid II flippase
VSLSRSIFTISFYTSLSRILGFARDILIARYLGVSLLSDAFFAAFKLPNFFRRIFAEGAFNSAFVPIFMEKMQDKNHKNEEVFFVRNVFSILFFALLIFTLIFQIFMPFFMKGLFPGFFDNTDKAQLLINLSRITIFYLFFISLVSLCSGILNSVGKFAVPASAPIILNSTLIASIFAFSSITPSYAHSLSWGVFVAGILQFIWLFIFTYKAGFLLYPKLPQFNTDMKKFFKRLIPGIIGANLLQINLLVSSIFASLISGGISYLYYADRISQLPLALIGIAIGVALLPNLAKKIKLNQIDGAIKIQNQALEIGLILVIPATLALTTIATPIISALFERGKFSVNETYHVARALAFYSIGLPAYVLVKIIEPAFFARSDTKTPMQVSFVCVAFNVALNCMFFYMGFGYLGIIFASVSASFLDLAILMIILLKRKHFQFEDNFLKKIALIFVSAILMSLSLIFLKSFFEHNNYFNKIIELIIIISAGIAVYGISSYFLGSLNSILKNPTLIKKLSDK